VLNKRYTSIVMSRKQREQTAPTADTSSPTSKPTQLHCTKFEPIRSWIKNPAPLKFNETDLSIDHSMHKPFAESSDMHTTLISGRHEVAARSNQTTSICPTSS